MSRFKHASGKVILYAAPYLMKLLSIVGTIAMFSVGGGILIHGLPDGQALLHHASEVMHTVPMAGSFLAAITPLLLNTLVGILLGGVMLGLVSLWQRILFRKNKS